MALVGACRKTRHENKTIFFKIFRRRRALSSKIFHRFHVSKCYSELKKEELLLQMFLLGFSCSYHNVPHSGNKSQICDLLLEWDFPHSDNKSLNTVT